MRKLAFNRELPELPELPELNEALASYAAVEPRNGLEQRVLANLRTHGVTAAPFGWQRWAAVTFGVAVLAALLVWFGGQHSLKIISPARPAQHDAATNGRPLLAAGAAQANADGLSAKRHYSELAMAGQRPQRRQTIGAAARTHAAALPRLAQFPAPEALTEQEELLIQFVEEDPQDAALVAEAVTERLQRETDQMKGVDSTPAAQQQEP